MSVEQMANSKRQSYLNLSRKIVFKVKNDKKSIVHEKLLCLKCFD